MGKEYIRMILPAGLGLGIGLFAAALKWIDGAAWPVYLAPALAALAGFALLRAWRDEEGAESARPLLAYILLVLAAYFLFGVAYAPYGMAKPIAALLAAGLLMPAFSEYVYDRGKFKFMEEEETAGRVQMQEE